MIRVSLGNFLEMYDFMVFGYYAAAIGRAFFPTKNEYASLMLSLMTFGTGYLMRPLGAIVLGAYIDHHGRRKGLLLTLALMAVGTLSIGIMPGYETIGFFAPLLVVLGRLVQGLSAGVEIGGVSVYLAEIATPGRKGFFVSWQSGSQQVAVIFAALIGLTLSALLRPEEMAGWGWRVPLLIGSMLIPFLFMLRRSLTETDEFIARKHHPGTAEIWRTVMANWRLVILGMMLSITTTVTFYLITAYMPTYGSSVLHLTAKSSMLVTLCVGISNLCFLPIIGALSDKVGRRPLLLLVLDHRPGHSVSRPAVAGQRPLVRTPVSRRPVVLHDLRQLQRSHGGVPHGSDAGERARLRLLLRLQPGDRNFRRLHAGHLDVFDPHHRRSRHARPVAFVRRIDGLDRDASAYRAQFQARSAPERPSGRCRARTSRRVASETIPARCPGESAAAPPSRQSRAAPITAAP